MTVLLLLKDSKVGHWFYVVTVFSYRCMFMWHLHLHVMQALQFWLVFVWTSKPRFTYIIVPVIAVSMWLCHTDLYSFCLTAVENHIFLLQFDPFSHAVPWSPRVHFTDKPTDCQVQGKDFSLSSGGVHASCAEHSYMSQPAIWFCRPRCVFACACACVNTCMHMYMYVCVPSGGFSLNSQFAVCQYDHCNCAFWRAANCDWRLPVSHTLCATFCFSRSIGSDRTFKSLISSSSTL